MRNIYTENKVLEAINNGRAPVGIFIYTRDPSIIEIVGDVGLDFVIIDTEHTMMNPETLEHQIITAQLSGLTPMVRVPGTVPYLIRSAVELGAQGVLVPHICSREDCREAQDYLRYPPVGKASTCRGNRSTGYQPANWGRYLEWAENVSLVALIEDPAAMNDLDGIIDELKPGRDMVMFGSADYGQSLGKIKSGGGVDDSEITEACNTIIQKCNERSIVFMACPSSKADAAGLQAVVDGGGKTVVLNTDQMIFRDSLEAILNNCRDIKFN